MAIHIDELNSSIEAPSRGRAGARGAPGDGGEGGIPAPDVAREELRETVRELVAEELARILRREALR